jgi:hypothetical protein
MYQLLYDGEQPAKMPNLPKRRTSDDIVWGDLGKQAKLLTKFRRLLRNTKPADQKALMFMAENMADLGRVR